LPFPPFPDRIEIMVRPSPNGVADAARRTTEDAVGAYEAAREYGEALRAQLPELKKKAERALNQGVEQLRGQARVAADRAGEELEHARLYVVDRVQERPFTTTLAALGAGFLIGLLFASRRR
jgi:ElaB/YqjD/DUF883 family membrane-anchored ribosome-binding protein